MSKKKLPKLANQLSEEGGILIIDQDGELVEGTPINYITHAKHLESYDGPLEVNIQGGTASQRMFIAGLLNNTMQHGGMTPIPPAGLTSWENEHRREASETGFGMSLGDLIRQNDPDLFDRPIPINIAGSAFAPQALRQDNRAETMTAGRTLKSEAELYDVPGAMISNVLVERLHEAGFRDIEVAFTDPNTGIKVGSFR